MNKEKNKSSSTKNPKKMTAAEFEEYFDNGGDLRGMVGEWKRAADINQIVNVDIPNWALASIDQEAKRRGVPRKSLIKMWIIDRIDELNSKPTKK